MDGKSLRHNPKLTMGHTFVSPLLDLKVEMEIDCSPVGSSFSRSCARLLVDDFFGFCHPR